MNRKEFLRQLRDDLLQTAAYIAHPLIEDDLEKMERVIDRISGIRWHPLPEHALEGEAAGALQVKEVFVEGKGLFLVAGEKTGAFGNECTQCRTVVHWLPHVKRFHCFLCGKEWSPLDGEGNLRLRRYPVKKRDGTWYVGLRE